MPAQFFEPSFDMRAVGRVQEHAPVPGEQESILVGKRVVKRRRWPRARFWRGAGIEIERAESCKNMGWREPSVSACGSRLMAADTLAGARA